MNIEKVTHLRHVEAGRKAAAARWRQTAERGRTVQARLYKEDAALLKSLVRWRGLGRSTAATVRAMLAASRGVLWETGPDGRPRPLPALLSPPSEP